MNHTLLPDLMAQKRCRKCGAPYPVTEFVNGRTWCRACVADSHRNDPATDGYQTCRNCGEVKHATEFYVKRQINGRRGGLVGRTPNCRACQSDRTRQIAYGLAPGEFDRIFDAQGRRCRICGTADFGQITPQLDHDHATGKVRGILCGGCNRNLGWYESNADAIAAYLG